MAGYAGAVRGPPFQRRGMPSGLQPIRRPASSFFCTSARRLSTQAPPGPAPAGIQEPPSPTRGLGAILGHLPLRRRSVRGKPDVPALAPSRRSPRTRQRFRHRVPERRCLAFRRIGAGERRHAGAGPVAALNISRGARAPRLCHSRRAGPRRHGDRLQGAAGGAQSGGGAENDPCRRPGRPGRNPPFSPRGRSGGTLAAPPHRAGARGRRARRPAVLLPGICRGGHAVGPPRGHAAGAPPGRRPGREARPRDAPRPPARRHSPRSQAG